MTRMSRNLLICEALVCFCPAAWALLVPGLGALSAFFNAELSIVDAPFLAWLVGGAAGLVGVVNLLRWLLHGSAFLRPRLGMLAVLCGIAAAAIFLVGLAADSAMKWGGRIVLLAAFGLPIASAAHLAYLARDYLLDREEEPRRAGAVPPRAVSGDSANHNRRWRTAAAAALLLSVIMNLVPDYGAPQHSLTRFGSDSLVWIFGWPLTVFVYDPLTGLHWGLGALVVLPAQLLVLAVLLIVAYWRRASSRCAVF
jgi:hypothetical protein